ncbi:hypothetical protein CHELA40_14854 [Chelatococcus asaccharovorans]|nr:hypothetical protein CHELA17_60768 [Chelatococcus asaccharovorans]CAH1680370.1 hypothetical protein CHELA40_14854 [Chelatococcus asaccharovorans]
MRYGLFGSPSRTRTCDKAVNSRLLYQLSYRGSLTQGSGYSMSVRTATPFRGSLDVFVQAVLSFCEWERGGPI